MERVVLKDRPVVRYDVGDRIMVGGGPRPVPGVIVYLGKFQHREGAFEYGVRIDGEEYTRKIGHAGIV